MFAPQIFSFGGGVNTGDIRHSLRFRGAQHLAKPSGTPTNRNLFCASLWVKRSLLGSLQTLLWSGIDNTSKALLRFDASDRLHFYSYNGGAKGELVSTAYFRDPTAQMHLFVLFDFDNATATERVKAWVNGTQISFTTNTTVVIGSVHYLNTTNPHRIASDYAVSYFSGYLSRIAFVDGQALAPTDFGYFNQEINEWVTKGQSEVKAVVDAGGANSYMLDFDDGTNLTSLGYDKSSKGNHWTLTGHSLTDGADYDWMLDVPGNSYATLNSLYTGKSTLSKANLTASGTTDLPTIQPASGNWYFEISGVAKNWTPPAAFPAAAGDYNFGQRPFTNTPTVGYSTLCQRNLPEPVILNPSEHFTTLLHTGTGAAQVITGAEFEPDLAWVKCRNTASTNHLLVDSVRGDTIALSTNSTGIEVTSTGYPTLTADGFSVDGSATWANGAGYTFADWLWKAGGAAVGNNAGTISSQVSANVDAGFSVVTYTAAPSSTVGHGLQAAPELVIIKSRNKAVNWVVGHKGVTWAGYLTLNTTSAYAADTAFWNSTAPTSEVFTLGSGITLASYGDMVAYCFHSVGGFSKVGSYTGNGSADGPYVDCGFKPAFILCKRTDAASSWWITDSARNPSNVASLNLYPESSAVEGSAGCPFDLLAAGFKARSATYNVSAAKYIFIAFAEVPAKYSLAR